MAGSLHARIRAAGRSRPVRALQRPASTVTLLAYTAVYVLLSTTGLLLLRSALGGTNHPVQASGLSGLLTNPSFLVGGCLYALSFLTWLLALRAFEITTVYPVFIGSSFSAVTLGAVLFLGESLSVSGVIGIVLVGSGVVLLVR